MTNLIKPNDNYIARYLRLLHPQLTSITQNNNNYYVIDHNYLITYVNNSDDSMIRTDITEHNNN